MKGNVKFNTIYGVYVSLLFQPLFTSSPSTLTSETESVCKSEGCLASAKILKDSIDFRTNPCDDFYQFACGDWPKNHRNLEESAIIFPSSSLEMRLLQNEEDILKFLKQNNQEDEPEPVHKARQLYSMCLERESYDGIQSLKDILVNIGLPIVPSPKIENPNFQYDRALAKAARMAGIMMFFSATVDDSPFNHSRNTIILSQPVFDLDSGVMPSKYGLKEIANLLNLSLDRAQVVLMEEIIDKINGNASSCSVGNASGSESGDALNAGGDYEFKAVIVKQTMEQIDIMLTKRPKFNSTSLIPIKRTLEELQNITDTIANDVRTSLPKFNWTRYLEETFEGLENVTLDLTNASNVHIVIEDMNYIEDILKFMYKKNIKDIESELWWKTVKSLAPYADFDIFQTKIIISEGSIENSCKNIIANTFEMVLSYMYMENEKFEIAKNELENMLQFLKESYKQIIEQATWMDPNTKEKALLKLESMKSHVAYPNSTQLQRILVSEGYDKINITRSLFETVIGMAQLSLNTSLGKLNQLNSSPNENWPMSPITVNAAYDHAKNAMFIPAAILAPPLYINTLKALVYGLLGSVLGHEISHGFDHSGRQFNSEGVLENWWNNETAIKYEEKSACFLKAYDNYFSTFDGEFQKTKSILTLDEDMSDNSGFRAALLAYRIYVTKNGKEPALHNFEKFTSEQLFTLGFANFYCENPTQISSALNKYADHSPNGVRVNGVFKHSQDFADIWNCPEGSTMNPKSEKCSLW